MPLSSHISPCNLLEGCARLSKRQIVEQMLLKMAVAGCFAVAELPGILEAVMRRERLGSTGIGQGIAMPHTRHAAIERTMIGAFLAKPPAPFDCIDGELADIFFLFLAPRDDRQDRTISRNAEALHRELRRAEFCAEFRRCESAEEIRQLLESIEH